MDNILPIYFSQLADIMLIAMVMSFITVVINLMNLTRANMNERERVNEDLRSSIYNSKYDNSLIYAQDIISLVQSVKDDDKYIWITNDNSITDPKIIKIVGTEKTPNALKSMSTSVTKIIEELGLDYNNIYHSDLYTKDKEFGTEFKPVKGNLDRTLVLGYVIRLATNEEIENLKKQREDSGG